jgi:hypothetical protein
MPAIQTSYGLTQARFVEGMIPDMRPRTVVSRVVETAAGIGFGKVAVRGTGDNQVRVSEASRGFVGIAVLDNTQVGATADTYPQNSVANIITKGPVVVIASVAVADGDPVYFVPATGVLTNVSTSNTLIPNAVWEVTTTTTNQLSVVYLG